MITVNIYPCVYVVDITQEIAAIIDKYPRKLEKTEYEILILLIEANQIEYRESTEEEVFAFYEALYL